MDASWFKMLNHGECDKKDTNFSVGLKVSL